MKSHVSENLIEVLMAIYRDCCERCDALQPQYRDELTIRSRVESEGISFLTITLPDLGKDLERSLDQGFISPTLFRSFKKRGKIPAFLQGFFGLIFDVWTGRILYEEISADLRRSACAIECVRQLAYAFKKLRLACTPERERRAIEDYKNSEQCFNEPVDETRVEYFRSVCRVLWAGAFRDINPGELMPKHGPGATADRRFGNAKYAFTTWHDRLEGYFPCLSFAFCNSNAVDSKDFEKLSIIKREEELPVRVVFVPKTLKSPRVIAIEPSCQQYVQQALAGAIMKELQTYDFSRGHINFADQTINQKLAIASSLDGRLATIDLSSASDRVPRDLALAMFDHVPDLRDAIDACRSTSAKLPNGDVLPLKKFASMGSALCFPIESMYFYALCVGALLEWHNLPVTYLNIKHVVKYVYVYGDDILVPSDSASFVVDYLQKYYCKVNAGKSFWTGKFRESCGVDAYGGELVTPTYFRELPANNKRDSKAIVSWVSTGNQLYKRGFWRSADLIKSLVERVIGRLPIVHDQSPALGWTSFQRWVSIDRWNKQLHRSEIRAWVVTPVYRKSPISGYPALLKCLMSLERKLDGAEPGSVDKEHLSRHALHGVVTLKRRWVPAL